MANALLESTVAVVPNNAPVAMADSYSINEDATLTVPAAGVLSNDTDADANTLSAVLVTTTGNGILTLNANGSFTYTPNANYNGNDSFTYKANDGTDDSNVVNVAITVNPVNDAPVANGNNYGVSEDGTLTVGASGVLANDTDIDGGPLNAVLVTSVSNGSLTLNSNGSFVYTPATNFNGVDSFTYRANDGSLNSNITTVNITVSPVNDAPVAYDDTFTATEDTNKGIDPRTNDTDVEGNTLTTIIVTPPANGNLVLRPDGSYRYEPNANFNGIDTFTYQVTDGTDLSNIASVSVFVASVNDVPVANDDSYVTGEDQVLNVPAANGVRANDTDVEDGGNGLKVLATSSPAHGTVVLNPNGSFTYTPQAGFVGVDSFNYEARDTADAVDSAVVTIYVNNLNNAPVAVDDVYAVNEDTLLDVTTTGVLKNDTDADGDVTTASVVTYPLHGTLTFYLHGQFKYTPNANYVGTDSFTYQAFDSQVMSNVATVTLTVGDVNDLPVANNDYYSVLEDNQLVIGAPGVLANDSDVDGDQLYASLSAPIMPPPPPFPLPIFTGTTAHGSLELSADGSFKYTPQPNFYGIETFTYYVTDGTGNSNEATVTINVEPVVDTPVAVDDSYDLVEDHPFNAGTMASVLANDTFELNPFAFLGGPIGFPVSNQGQAVTLDSSASPNSPIISDQVLSFVAVQDDVDHGQLSMYDDPYSAMFGFFDYTPDPDFSGTDSFKYVIFQIDPNSFQVYVSNVATVTLNVAPENDVPVANPDAYSTAEDQALTVGAPGVLANDTDVDGDSLTAVLQSNPAYGSLTFTGNGAFTYTPNANYNGPDSFTYVTTDGTSTTEATTVTINVSPVGDTPVAVNDAYVTDEDTSLTLNGANGVLLNDSDPDGGALQAKLIAGPINGTVFLKNNGAIDYLAHPNYNGPDSFTYYVTNGTNNSAPATVNITVVPVADAPVANPNTYGTPEDTLLTVGAPGVLADDFDADNDPLTAAISGQPLHGTVNLNSDGSFTYQPASNYVGGDSFTYTVSDGTTQTLPVNVTINIGGQNDAPVAVDDVYSTGTEDQQVIIQVPGVLGNDSDADGNALSAVLVQMPQHGTVNLLPTGRIVYTPFQYFNGTDSFTYRAFDGEMYSNVATVTLNIASVNNAPEGNEDFYNTAEDTPLTIPAAGVLANDFDQEGDALTAHLLNQPMFGSVTLNADGSFTYTPQPNFNSEMFSYYFPSDGDDEFVYEVVDANGGVSEPVTVYIHVTSVADQPVAVDDNYNLNEDTTFDSGFLGASVLANDTFEFSPFGFGLGGEQGPGFPGPLSNQGSAVSPNSPILGTSFSFAVLQDNVDHGTLNFDPEFGFFDYTPDPDFSGTDSFTYVIAQIDPFNPSFYVSNPATVTFNVMAVNDPPVAAADNFSTPEDTPLTVATAGVLSNDTDADGNSLTAILQNNPGNGTLALNGDGSFTYTPNANWFGTDLFTYYATDGTSTSEVTTVTINVTPVNDLPVTVNDTFITNEDTTLTVVAPGIIQNDTDVDDTALTVSLVNGPLNGTLSIYYSGAFDYVPNANFNGVDTFTYRAHDGKGAGNLATVTITVNPVNDAPVGNADNYGTNEGLTLNVGPRGVLNNDVDVDGDVLTASLLSNPLHGTVALAGDGSFLYTPNEGFSGMDTFFYLANDGVLSTEATTVTITVGAVNDPPVARDDTFSVYEDTPTTIPAPGVLMNDYDPEDDVLTATLVSMPQHGSITFYEDGSFFYTPNPNYTGPDSFTYQANDGVSDSNVATVDITVVPLNDEPLANEDYYSTDEEQSITVAAPGVLGNDFDDEGAALTALLRDNPLHGVLNLNGDGSFTYTPDSGYFGEDVFTYNANDGTTNSLYTTVTILVRPINDAPVANDDVYIADEDTTLSVPAAGVLANDTDDDGDVLSATLVLQPLHGTVFLNEDGSFEYLAYPNFQGTDSFVYRATDGLLNSNPATVTLTVRNAPDAPVANPDSYGTQEDTPITINAPGVLADDYDLDGDPLTAIMINNPLNGIVTLQPDGGFTYTPHSGFNGADVFTYVANDGTTNSAETTVTINVGAVNNAPVAKDDLFNVFEDQLTTISIPGVLANDTDSDNTTLTVTLINGPLYGTLVLNSDGSFSYEPFPNFNGTDSFTYQANDGMLDSNVATVTLNVVPVDDAPLANPDMYSTNEEQPITVAAPGVLGNDSDSDGTVLIALLQDNPLHGTVALNGDGSFTYTPEDGFSGVDRFTYRANDGNSNSDATTVTIAVIPRNDAPVAVTDTYIATEDTTLTVVAPGVLANDTDDDGDTITATLVVPPLHGALVLNSDGSFEYAPYPNYSGSDQFVYRNNDGTVSSNDAVVNITVAPVQDVPTGNADVYSTQENTPINIPAPGVLANDVDLDGDTLSAIPVDYPINGNLALLSDGSFIYTPNTNFNGIDVFTYQASDTYSVSNLTTVTINVGPVNDAPVAHDDVYNVFEDMATTISAPGVLANDTDTDEPSTLTAVLINGPLNGTVVLNDDGSFTYTPIPNYNGTDSFTYQANDGLANSNVATVTLNVVPQDDPPLANEDYYVVDEDQTITVAAPGVLGNDSDSDGSVLIALLQAEPPHGQITLNGDGSFTYTPDPGYSGPDFFTYQANDGVSNSAPTTATIVVRPRNDRPTAISDTYVVVEDDTLNIAAPGVLLNDTDDDDDALTATLIVPTLHGSVTLNPDGSFSYSPNPNYNGTDTFTYRASDGIELSNEATVTIIVTPKQDPPTANPDNYSTPEDTQLVVAAPGVLGDDVDLDNDPLTAQLVDGALHGTISLNADGSFTYTPNPSYSGPDSFTYKAYDGHTVSNVATVNINVGPVNDVPVANPDVYSLFEDTTSNISAPGVLQNDTDGDNDALTAVLITGPLNGTLTLNANGSFSYTPFPNFTGIDTFTYQATDGIADSNVTTVTLNVVAQQDKPLANPDFFSTTEDLPLVVPTPGVLGNDFDADGEMLTSIIQDNPLNGTVLLNGDGSFTYTPNLGYFGTDVFTYRANDGTENSDKTTVTITIHPRNDVPVTADDIYSAVEDTPLNVPAANGVLKNDTDADGDTLSAVLVNQPLHGSVALNGDGSFTYTPNANFNGQDYFTYRAYDGTDYSTPPAKVVINVAPVQDTPVAVNDSFSIPEDKVLNVVIPGVLGNDIDVDNEPLTAHLVDAPQHGIITLNQNGSFSYTPDEDFFGIDTFTYYANDGKENSNLATVTINVGGRNDGPVAVDDHYVTMEDTPLTPPAPGVLGNDTDDDGDTLQAVLITPPNHGTLVLNADGSFTYTPFANYSGPDSFVYRANDGTTLSNPATVSIDVITVNDAPVLSNAIITTPLNENSVATLTADLYDADPADTHLVTVNWGDGSAPTIVTIPAGQIKIFLTHQYLDDNPTGTPVDINNVTLTVQDNNGGSDTENLTVTVNNLAPTFENVSLTQVVPTGGTARLQGTIKDVGTLDTFVLTVNWGDGNTQVFNHGPGTSNFDYLHVYAVPGTYVVTVTVQDDDGGITTITPGVNVRNTADLILTKTANPDPASVGELLTYTMIVTNKGPDMAHNVILMDTLPSNVEITSSTPHLIPADGVLNWFLGDIASGQTLRVDLIVKTLQQGPITNVATVVSDDLDPNQANNTAAVTTTIGWLPDGPDLMADAVTVDTICKLTSKGPKCTMKLWALVANRGTQRANAGIYSVYLSDDNIFSPTGDMKLKTKKFAAMNPGQVKAQRQSIKTPPGFVTTGKFMIVVLDEGNLVFEGNETNNLIIYGPLP